MNVGEIIERLRGSGGEAVKNVRLGEDGNGLEAYRQNRCSFLQMGTKLCHGASSAGGVLEDLYSGHSIKE